MSGSSGRSAWLFPSLRDFSPAWLPGDAIAAMTLAAIAIPEQLATARLVGMPPMTGLFAFAAGSLAFAAFGANRFMSVGGDSTIAPIMAGALAVLATAGTAHYSGMAAVLALLIARSLTRPIIRLTEAVQDTARDGRAIIPVEASGETGVLARAFAQAMEEVNAKTDALEREVLDHRQRNEGRSARARALFDEA